jgi:hypothetical protein
VAEQKRKAPAGWYKHPSMADTRRYWDGQKWTDHIAPAETKRPAPKQTGALTIARGVALGIAAVIGGLMFLYSCQSDEAWAACDQRSVERVSLGLPALDCP